MKHTLLPMATVALLGALHIGEAQADVLITNPGYDQQRPAMTSAPNGNLYVAVEDGTAAAIDTYGSTDGGATWSRVFRFSANADDLRNPAIAYAESPERVYVAFCWAHNTDRRNVTVFWFDPTNPVNWGYANVTTGHIMTNYIYPAIDTDYLAWPSNYYVYLTYALPGVDSSRIYFSRSVDRGASWSPPTDVTGGSENTSYLPRPDIAYGRYSGSDNVLIGFVKPGWNGSTWTKQIWVTKSANFGTSWDTAVQLTDQVKDVYHPRVVAAINNNSVVVAYTYEYSTSNLDIHYAYSTNGGTSWITQQSLAVSGENEKSVGMAGSHTVGRFHAAFWREYAIKYTWANVATPGSWASPVTVNEGNTASAVYPRPAVSVNATRPLDEEACVAWTDFRGFSYDVYFYQGSPPTTTSTTTTTTSSVSTTTVIATFCGDSLIDYPEECDDGNTEDGDGCSQFCVIEQCYTCSGAGPGSCSCDDGTACGVQCANQLTCTDAGGSCECKL